MPIHATVKPVKALDGHADKYMWDHITDFYNTTLYHSILKFNDEQLDEFFEFLTNHGDIMVKIHGEPVREVRGFVTNPNRKFKEPNLDKKYQEWLAKNE
jgi:hypothetical protein